MDIDFNAVSPEGDLPPNHPLVLKALQGIISGPISELRTSVDGNITNPTSNTGLQVGKIDYNNILPVSNNNNNRQNVIGNDANLNIANSVLQVFDNSKPNLNSENFDENDDQMELPLFKQTEISDIHKKMFDLEKKLDLLLSYARSNKN